MSFRTSFKGTRSSVTTVAAIFPRTVMGKEKTEAHRNVGTTLLLCPRNDRGYRVPQDVSGPFSAQEVPRKICPSSRISLNPSVGAFHTQLQKTLIKLNCKDQGLTRHLYKTLMRTPAKVFILDHEKSTKRTNEQTNK